MTELPVTRCVICKDNPTGVYDRELDQVYHLMSAVEANILCQEMNIASPPLGAIEYEDDGNPMREEP